MERKSERTEVTLAPAGTIVSVVLVTPIDLSGSSATVIARAHPGNVDDAKLPDGARFVGTVSGDDDGRLSLRFSRLLLPDGREARVVAEAQDRSGSFGVQGRIEQTTDSEPSGAGGVARDTATDVALDALGGGIAGQAARSYTRRSSRGESIGSPRARIRVTLSAGTTFSVFLHEAAIARQ
jgi:hypothetical protein